MSFNASCDLRRLGLVFRAMVEKVALSSVLSAAMASAMSAAMRRVHALSSHRRLTAVLVTWRMCHAVTTKLALARRMGEGRCTYLMTNRAMGAWRRDLVAKLRDAHLHTLADNAAARSGAWRRRQERATGPRIWPYWQSWVASTGSVARSPRGKAVRLGTAWRRWSCAWTAREGPPSRATRSGGL